MNCEMVNTLAFFRLMRDGDKDWEHKSIDIRGLFQQTWKRIPFAEHKIQRVGMQVIEDVLAMSAWGAAQRRVDNRVGFIPTMGALHEGHLALVDQALATCDAVVASVFVNPLQFNNPEDLRKYPRQLDQDRALLEAQGCHVLFVPTNEGLYAKSKPKSYELAALDQVLEGPSRPGHFQGVVNVVERLFNYTRPDKAFFGEKDRQQLAVIRHIAQQERWPEQIIGCPTVRAADGLALSSRNARLTPEERTAAPLLYHSLCAVAQHAFDHSVDACKQAGLEILASEPRVHLDYLEIAHPLSLQPLTDWGSLEEASVLIAASFGNVRLIDNLTLRR